MMNAKEKFYFLVNHIDNAQYITPAGNSILIDINDPLNNKLSERELHGAMQKLSEDLGIIEITGSTDSDPDQFFSYEAANSFLIKTTPKFQKYKEGLEHDPDYRRFTYGYGSRAQKEASKPSHSPSDKPTPPNDAVTPKFSKEFNAIVFMNEIIKIPKNTNQSELCNILFAPNPSNSRYNPRLL